MEWTQCLNRIKVPSLNAGHYKIVQKETLKSSTLTLQTNPTHYTQLSSLKRLSLVSSSNWPNLFSMLSTKNAQTPPQIVWMLRKSCFPSVIILHLAPPNQFKTLKIVGPKLSRIWALCHVIVLHLCFTSFSNVACTLLDIETKLLTSSPSYREH